MSLDMLCRPISKLVVEAGCRWRICSCSTGSRLWIEGRVNSYYVHCPLTWRFLKLSFFHPGVKQEQINIPRSFKLIGILMQFPVGGGAILQFDSRLEEAILGRHKGESCRYWEESWMGGYSQAWLFAIQGGDVTGRQKVIHIFLA